MKSLFEEFGDTYTLGKDGMYYPDLIIEKADQRPIGKWGRMHREYLKEQHPSLYQRLILNGTLVRHLADANERATAMLDSLITQMAKQERITEQLKAAQPMIWVGRMNSICSRAEEIVMEEASIPCKQSSRWYDREDHTSGYFSFWVHFYTELK